MEDNCKVDAFSIRFIAESTEARSIIERLSNEGIVGVDTETIWQPEGARISLLQIATRESEVIVLDALSTDAEVWRPLVDSPNVLMAAHNARFDEAVLAASGLKPAGFVDTLRLARAALRLPSYSLAEVVRHLFGITLDKSFQKSNWRRRPLSPDQLAYAARDAHLALCVYDKLEQLLRKENRWEKAYRHAVLSTEPGAEEGKGRKRQAANQPLPPLTPDEKRIVLELKKWRLEQAFAARVPAYMICPDRTLHHLAQEKPATIDALASVYGLGESKISRYGEALLEALRQAVAQNSNR